MTHNCDDYDRCPIHDTAPSGWSIIREEPRKRPNWLRRTFRRDNMVTAIVVSCAIALVAFIGAASSSTHIPGHKTVSKIFHDFVRPAINLPVPPPESVHVPHSVPSIFPRSAANIIVASLSKPRARQPQPVVAGSSPRPSPSPLVSSSSPSSSPTIASPPPTTSAPPPPTDTPTPSPTDTLTPTPTPTPTDTPTDTPSPTGT